MSKKVPRQKVIIELSNGKKGVFEGIAICWPDEIHDLTVTNVVFQVPTMANPKNVTEPKQEAPPTPKPAAEPPPKPEQKK